MIKVTDATIDGQQRIVTPGAQRYINPECIVWIMLSRFPTGRKVATGNKVPDPSKQPTADGPAMMDEMVNEFVYWTDISFGSITLSVIESPEEILAAASRPDWSAPCSS